jgi:hypothetical protein
MNFASPVADQQAEPLSVAIEIHQQATGRLSHPHRGGMVVIPARCTQWRL